MIHPSYKELIQEINDRNTENTQEPLVKSRYSIVIAASHRARQLVDGHQMDDEEEGKKALSVAVEELYGGDINIISEQAYEEAMEAKKAAAEEAAEEELLILSEETEE